MATTSDERSNSNAVIRRPTMLIGALLGATALALPSAARANATPTQHQVERQAVHHVARHVAPARSTHHPDFDGDGYADLPIGAFGDKVASADVAGRLWVVYGGAHGANTGNRHTAFTESSIGRGAHSDTGDTFGFNTAWADMNGDGYDDLAIGAPDETVNGHANAGAVVVLYGSRAGLTIATGQYFTEAISGLGPAPADTDLFGRSLAAGDFNGDGYGDLAVGAPGRTTGAITGSGAVMILFGTAHGLSHAAPLLPQRVDESTPGLHGGVHDDLFGLAVTAGDFNGDGIDDLAASAPYQRVGSKFAGGVVQMLRGTANGLVGAQTWTEDTTGVPDTVEAGDFWGMTLASLDVNGDHRDELVVGAPIEAQGATSNVGAATLLFGAPGGLSSVGAQFYLLSNTTFDQSPAADNCFANSIAPLDFDGDGRMDLAFGVATRTSKTAKTKAGEVVVLHNVGGRLSRTGGFVLDRDTSGMIGPSAANESFGARIVPGDFSGNGRDDFAVSALGLTVSGKAYAGAMQVFYGASTGVGANDQLFTANSLGGTPSTGARLGGYDFLPS